MRFVTNMTAEPSDLVTVEHVGGVARVTLSHGKVNALSVEVLEALGSTATMLAAEPPGCVVITGGERHFAAGADITRFDPSDPDGIARIGRAFLDALGAVAAIPRPVIAEIAGFALGGGCELALACDLRVAADTAKLGQPEILLGIIPGGGGTQRLARLIGPSRAKDLIFTGRTVDAVEALHLGLVDRVVPASMLRESTMELANSLASGPRRALAMAKDAIDSGLDSTLAEGLDREQRLFVDVFATPDAATGVASFLANGPGAAVFER